MICDVCDKESGNYGEYYEAGGLDDPSKLLLRVCIKCDTKDIILNAKHEKKAVTKKLRDYVKLQ